MKKINLAILLLVTFASICLAQEEKGFIQARPIWPNGLEGERNLFVGFRTVFEAPEDAEVTLQLAGSSLYRIFLNGVFVGHGPARGPHGYYRVDHLDLSGNVTAGQNLLAIEVAGYNVNSFYLLDQPAFLQAEIVVDGRVVASTAGDHSYFQVGILKERVRKVQRYSFQRPFTEVYRLAPNDDAWRKDRSAPFETIDCSVQDEKKLLPRRIPFADFFKRPAVWQISSGEIQTGFEPERLWKDRALTGIGPNLGGFQEDELAVIPSIELQKIKSVPTNEFNELLERTSLSLTSHSYRILDFGTNLTGFLGAAVSCAQPTKLYFTFDEVLSDGDVDFKRLSCVNIIAYELEPGTYALESFEPYTLRYLKIIVIEGECKVGDIYLREYVNPDVWQAHFSSSDRRLNQLFVAGRETFRQNAVDIFMDCPSRERAGWLCDSFFTSRVAFDFSGDATIEKNFYENYLLPDRFAYLPDEMLSMCYPADHNDGVFIPNWALWFVVELEEYAARSGDHDMIDDLKAKVYRLFDYFKKFKNSDGLLEKLESWVFVEWSAANQFVQDVNYPSNMLYAATLAAAGRIYGDSHLLEQADCIRETIRKQSFDGEFFVDNAVREKGELKPTRNRTEVCQYFAFFFDIANPTTHETLWNNLATQFGPKRKQTKAFTEIHEANAFIGNVLRLEILSRYGRCQQILDESIDYNLYMAERTGTLWENVGAYASCNHGFASHIVHTLYRDVLGLYRIDSVHKKIKIRLTDLAMDWCEGSLPIGDGRISMQWWKEEGKFVYRMDVPADYQIEVENLCNGEVVRKP
ncbi:MAG: hypothetical protein C4527_28100 [Candidatus Omnitrophota bacterium]|jgi:alpha-L-rhamnosidase|nr:MAG: hypothetical protein C4527_28100 [Candidatus Omnitrophota bacterium]